MYHLFAKRIQAAIVNYPNDEPLATMQKKAYLYSILESLLKLPIPYPGTNQDPELVEQTKLIIDAIKNDSFEVLLRNTCLEDEGITDHRNDPNDKDHWFKFLLGHFNKKIL